MLEWLGEGTALVIVGLVGGVALGLAARLGRFCTLGALEDLFYGRDGTRARMWLAALGLSVAGTQGLMLGGVLAPGKVFYLTTAWMPLASVAGGLAFGYGMALAGNCGFGALARVGGGDLRSLVIVLVMGVAAYATIAGPLAPLRVTLFAAGAGASPQGLAAPALGLGLGLALAATALLGGARLRVLGWGTLVAAGIVTGWAGTAWVAHEGFAATTPASHTFAAPLGETLTWLMSSTGREAGFAVGSVAGVLVGAFAGSLIKGHFRWEACEDPRELRRQMGGAVLMGVGAVVAMGCSVGQGLTAFSVLAWSAPVTLGAIVAGAWVGLRQLVGGYAVP
ncbi:YeeE/YedE family protein [Jannaschia sp. Os4]|uniref:YeeE/YedE family protein n=1 Tax=Jannaschia sp. Os4 TaxID=2807617 RepID=UPI00193A6286|nr:YeeE/YedE family protein [Jannaschia sp. Os4]MBM2576324.1 YeeE/YedE family protein [Jannaschia sp. Os4]